MPAAVAAIQHRRVARHAAVVADDGELAEAAAADGGGGAAPATPRTSPAAAPAAAVEAGADLKACDAAAAAARAFIDDQGDEREFEGLARRMEVMEWGDAALVRAPRETVGRRRPRDGLYS